MKCRVRVTKTESYDVDIVAVNMEDAQSYARIGANQSNKSETSKAVLTQVKHIYTENG